ncbi:MAG: site-specific integrase [Thiohalocapsa sp.]
MGGFLDLKYGPWVEANRKTGAETLARIRACFGDLMARPLPNINSWLIENWRKDRLKQGRSPSTVNRDLVALKATLQKAVDWELIDVHPLAKVKPAKVDNLGIVRYLSADEERRLRKALAGRDAEMKAARARGNVWREERGLDPMPETDVYGDHMTPMVLLSINTGLRRGELFNLTWADVDGGLLTVRGEGAKSGKTRHIPLNTEAADVLRQWKDQTNGTSGLVFVGKTGARFNNVKKAWAALLDAAGVTGFRWHDMRHHFASRLVQAGVDLNTVRELLGHADLTMTLRYAHLPSEHEAAAVALLVAQG